MIKEELQEITKKSVELLANCVVEAFNNNYNLDLDVNQILENITNEPNTEENKKEISENVSKENDDDDEIVVLMENLCLAIKKDGTKCNKKTKGNNLLCGNHDTLKSSISLSEYIDIVFKEKNYEIKPKVIYLGNNWADDTKMDKWPQIITTTTNFLRSYILFFTEFDDYFGAGIFVIQYNSSIKKKSYCLATHYVEVNNYCEFFGGCLYVKVNFTSLKKLEDKPLYNRITDMLNSYGIPYNVDQINKGKKDCSDSNPIVTVSKINDILYNHNNVMFFIKDDYLKFFKENQEDY